MRTDRHEEGFGHRGDLIQFRDPAGADDIRHDVLRQLLLQDRAKLPASIQPLTDAYGHIRALAKLTQGIPILRRHRLLEPA